MLLITNLDDGNLIQDEEQAASPRLTEKKGSSTKKTKQKRI